MVNVDGRKCVIEYQIIAANTMNKIVEKANKGRFVHALTEMLSWNKEICKKFAKNPPKDYTIEYKDMTEYTRIMGEMIRTLLDEKYGKGYTTI